MPPLQQVFADPPILITLNFNGPVVEEIGHDFAAPRRAFATRVEQGQAQNDEGAAFHHQGFFPGVVRVFVQQAFKALAMAPFKKAFTWAV